MPETVGTVHCYKPQIQYGQQSSCKKNSGGMVNVFHLKKKSGRGRGVIHVNSLSKQNTVNKTSESSQIKSSQVYFKCKIITIISFFVLLKTVQKYRKTLSQHFTILFLFSPLVHSFQFLSFKSQYLIAVSKDCQYRLKSHLSYSL